MFLGDYIKDINKKYRKFFFSGISFDTDIGKKEITFFLQ